MKKEDVEISELQNIKGKVKEQFQNIAAEIYKKGDQKEQTSSSPPPKESESENNNEEEDKESDKKTINVDDYEKKEDS